MVIGADSANDMTMLSHGRMGKLSTFAYATFGPGFFPWTFVFGHLRPFDAVAFRWLGNLAAAAPITAGIDGLALVDIDGTITEVQGCRR
jgi:hypothetical protein